jgi:hypothetical protein
MKKTFFHEIINERKQKTVEVRAIFKPVVFLNPSVRLQCQTPEAGGCRRKLMDQMTANQ